MSMSMDTSAFEALFVKASGPIAQAAMEAGLGDAAGQLLNDSLKQEPAVPLDEGTLRGSGSAFVRSELIQTTEALGKGGKPNRDQADESDKTHIVATVGFNTPYAARLHEHPEYNFREPGTGGKYLERPMQVNKELYLKIAGAKLKAAMR